jgi:hypothetical protein
MTQPWTPPTSSGPTELPQTPAVGVAEPAWGPPAPPAKPPTRRGKLIGVIVAPIVAVLTFVVLRGAVDRPAPVPVEVDTRMAIAAPFTIGTTDAAMETEFRKGFQGQSGAEGLRDLGVRSIVRDGEIVGFLVIADVGLRSSNEDDFHRGFEQGAPAQGATAEQRTFKGRKMVFARTPDAVMVMWTSAPLAYLVFALDTASAELLTSSVLAAVPASP